MSAQCFWLKKDNQILAYFMDYLVKAVSAPDINPIKRDKILTSAFDDTYLVQYRSLNNNMYQVIAASYQTIEDIYKQLPSVNHVQLVPYGLAVMALLLERGVDLSQLTVFVDYQPDNIWVTIFDQGLFNAPRSLRSVEASQVMVEVERSIKHYQQMNPDQGNHPVRIITNEQLGVNHPAQEGLKVGRYDIHFDLPQRVIATKRKALVFKRLVVIGIAVLLLIISVVVVTMPLVSRNQLENDIKKQEVNVLKSQEKLKRMVDKKMYSLMKSSFKPNFRAIYQDVLKNRHYGLDLNDLNINEVEAGGVWKARVVYNIQQHVPVSSLKAIEKQTLGKEISFRSNEQQQQIELVFRLKAESSHE